MTSRHDFTCHYCGDLATHCTYQLATLYQARLDDEGDILLCTEEPLDHPDRVGDIVYLCDEHTVIAVVDDR